MSLLSLQHLIWLIPTVILATLAIWYSIRARRKTIALLAGHADTCHLKSNASPLRRKVLTLSLFIALVCAAFAVLRPSGGTVISEHRRPAKNLIILIDVSKSMGANDSDGLTRLEAAKLLARSLVDRRPTDRIGLLSFAGAAFPECPTTLDRTMLLKRIDNLSPGSVPVAGTDLETAFEEARALLTEEPPPGSAVLILSDGDNITGKHDKVVESFAKANIPIFSVAFGHPTSPAPVPNSVYETQADHEVLREIAENTSGIFLAGKPAKVDEQIDQLSTRIDAIELSGDNIAPELFDRPLDLYAYPLTAALVLLFLHLFLPMRTKKWHPLAAAITFCFFLPNLSQAQEERGNPVYEAVRQQALADEKPLLLIFTGSDWSPLSITFEEEILSHQVYQKWEKKTVVRLTVDLPRNGISSQQRRSNRQLAARFDIASYPTALFLDPQKESEIGRLTHDTKGPASWTKRADAILAGDQSESDTPASIDYLPEHVREQLEDESLTEIERSIGYYNKALETERADPELAILSNDRFKLLIDLYSSAAQEAPEDRPDLIFSARHKLGILHHRRGQSMIPEDIANMSMEEQMRLMQLAQGDPTKFLKNAQQSYRKALSLYRQAAPLKPGDAELSMNLAVVYRDLARVQAYIDYQKAFQKAVKTTVQALEQEKRFRKSLEHEVTSKKPINDAGVNRSAEAIRDLVQKSEAIQDAPTILEEEKLKEFRLAQEDIDLAPEPHMDRVLHPAVDHIQNALDHLIDPQEMQQQQQQGEGGEPGDEPQEGDEEEEGGEDPEGDRPDGSAGEEEEEEGEENQGDADADLRRSEKENGDLRDRLLDKLRREYRRKPKGKDH